MAAEYHWTARQVERELTDELLVLYLDEAVVRKRATSQASFDSGIESVRAGTIFAHDGRQYARWASRSRRGRGSGRNLAQLAHDFGGQVVQGEFEFRES